MKTDVAGAISGYYKQIYVATKELLSLKIDNSCVGIECGADVRVFHSNNMNESTEVKFYKSKIGLYSSEISKTIYNFYWKSYNDIKLTFSSNTEIPESDIFEKNTEEFTISNNFKKQFILHSLIKHNLNQSEENKIKISKYFKQCGTICNKCTSFYCGNCISNFVKRKINFYPSEFMKIIEINESVNIVDFSSKIQFQFENKDKIESITLLKNELLYLLKENYQRYIKDLNDIILEAVIHKIALSFFDTTVFNSILKTTKNIDYHTHKKLCRSDVIGFIKNYAEFLDEYTEDVLELKILDIVEKANLDKEKILFKFNQEYNEYLRSKNIIDVFDSSSIKTYFKNIGMKFKSDDEGNEVVKRFMLYNDGLGLIAYLMTLKISEISVYKDKLFIKANFDDKGLFIGNFEYYNYKNASQYVYNNKESENEFYRYAQVGDSSFLETVSKNCITPLIKIDKLGKSITLDEYRKINLLPFGIFNKLRELVSKNSNLLIISKANMKRKPFINALLSAIPNNLTTLIIAEDIISLPATDKRNPFFVVDSLKDDYESNITSLSSMVGSFDKCVALIDNYELDVKVVHKHQSLLLNKAKCLITTLNKDTSRFNGNMTYEDINQELSSFEKLDFSMFDYFVILENYYVGNNKQDVVQIIGK